MIGNKSIKYSKIKLTKLKNNQRLHKYKKNLLKSNKKVWTLKIKKPIKHQNKTKLQIQNLANINKVMKILI